MEKTGSPIELFFNVENGYFQSELTDFAVWVAGAVKREFAENLPQDGEWYGQGVLGAWLYRLGGFPEESTLVESG